MVHRLLSLAHISVVSRGHTQENSRKEERILADLKMLVDKTMNATAAEDKADGNPAEDGTVAAGVDKATAPGQPAGQ